jgi:hypothetical protein
VPAFVRERESTLPARVRGLDAGGGQEDCGSDAKASRRPPEAR